MESIARQVKTSGVGWKAIRAVPYNFATLPSKNDPESWNLPITYKVIKLGNAGKRDTMNNSGTYLAKIQMYNTRSTSELGGTSATWHIRCVEYLRIIQPTPLAMQVQQAMHRSALVGLVKQSRTPSCFVPDMFRFLQQRAKSPSWASLNIWATTALASPP